MAIKISLIVTTKNEKGGLSTLLQSIAKQTRRPDEIVISFAGAYDPQALTQYQKKLPLTIVELHASANRSVGRNRAIERAKYEHILISDAGCRLDPEWVALMAEGFREADVVAGFSAGEADTVFQRCQLPYVLVMPDRFDPKTFLPATRSMGITKSLWQQVGKFNEQYRFAEDYEFARRIQSRKIPIARVKTAIVYWRPRKTLPAFAKMIGEHAYGDGYSRTFRPKVVSIYVRYLVMIGLGIWQLPLGIGAFLLYLLYSIQKNYRYVKDPSALGYLPLLQVVSDAAVMSGTLLGWNASR